MTKVAGPDQVVAPELLIALRLSPRDAQRRNHGAGVRLVLVCQQQALAHVVETAAVVGNAVQRQGVAAPPVPLLAEPAGPAPKGKPERPEERGEGALEGGAKPPPEPVLPPQTRVRV